MVVVQSGLVLLWPETLASVLWSDEYEHLFLCQALSLSLSGFPRNNDWNLDLLQKIETLHPFMNQYYRDGLE